MTTLTFDTLAYAKQLTDSGVNKQQAEAHAEAFSGVLTKMVDNTLATKQDLKDLKVELKDEIRSLDTKIETSYSRLIVRMGSMAFTSISILSGLMVFLHLH